MNKQAILAVVIGALILVAASGAFLYSQNKPEESTKTVATKKATPTPNGAMASSITKLLTNGKTSKCTFEVSSEDGKTTGIIYTSGENARADITSEIKSKESTTHMIRVGDTFYMWGDSLPLGIKMMMSVNDLASKMQDNKAFNSFDPEKEVEFKCVTWTEDKKLFTPPTNIKFTSFENTESKSSITKTSLVPTESVDSSDNSDQCKICTSLTGAAKTACLAQFNCN